MSSKPRSFSLFQKSVLQIFYMNSFILVGYSITYIKLTYLYILMNIDETVRLKYSYQKISFTKSVYFFKYWKILICRWNKIWVATVSEKYCDELKQFFVWISFFWEMFFLFHIKSMNEFELFDIFNIISLEIIVFGSHLNFYR